MKIVQAFGQEQREAARFTGAVEATMVAAQKRIMLRAIMTAIVIALVFGSITLVLWEGATDVAAGRISGGSIAAFVLTGGIVAGSCGALTEVYGDLLRGAGAAGRAPAAALRRSLSDRVRHALLHEAVLRGAGELLVGGLGVAGGLRVGSTLLHEAGLRRTGELLVARGRGATGAFGMRGGGEGEQRGHQQDTFQGRFSRSLVLGRIGDGIAGCGPRAAPPNWQRR
jgi:hypothetical protein